MIAQKVRQVAGFGEDSKVIVKVEMTEAETDRLIVYLQEVEYFDRNSPLDLFSSRPSETGKDLLSALENCV